MTGNLTHYLHLKIGITALALLIALPASAAKSPNGHQLLSQCLVTASDHDGEQRFAACERFVDQVRKKLDTGAIHGIRACIPKDVSFISLIISGVAQLQTQEKLHEREAHVVLAESYARKWPCS